MTYAWRKRSKHYSKLHPKCEGCGTTKDTTVHHRDGNSDAARCYPPGIAVTSRQVVYGIGVDPRG